ncbi:MAG: 4Fe-4S single cluster domain-containing protein [Candidatus Paceibacterota bacterium]
MNLHGFNPRSCANGPGERVVIWVQGCPRKCPGCFNPDSHSFAEREMVSVEELESRVLAQEGIDGVTFSGGEPFAQAKSLAELAKRLHKRGLSVVCYTGYTLEQLHSGNRSDWNALLGQVDLLIDGPFIQEQRCQEPYRGSANQRIIFLTDCIRSEEVFGNNQTTEFTLGADGTVEQTGFPELPDLDAVMKEVSEILKQKEDSK